MHGRILRRAFVRILATAACSTLAVTGCSAPKVFLDTSEHDPGAVAAYGYGPIAGGDVVYQPDVVLIPSSPSAIRSASADGLVWTMDATAPGVADLDIGEIMFASSRAVGRVVRLRDDGGDRIVTLGPVDFTDVVRDATIEIDRALDLDAMTFQHVPALPGASWEPEAGGGGSAAQSEPPEVDAEYPPADGAATDETLPKPSAGQDGLLQIPVGDWQVRVRKSAKRLGVGLTRDGALKADLVMASTGSNIAVKSGVRVTGGVTTKSDFLLTGITALVGRTPASLGQESTSWMARSGSRTGSSWRRHSRLSAASWLIRCHSGTLQLTAGGGVGLELSPGVSAALKKLLPAKTKLELKAGIRDVVLKREQAIPDSPACR